MFSSSAKVIASTLICSFNLVLCKEEVMRLSHCKAFINFAEILFNSVKLQRCCWESFILLWEDIFPLKPTATITVVLSSPSGRTVNYFIRKPDSQQHSSRDSDKSPLTRQFKSNVLLSPIHKSLAEKLEFCIQLL